MDHGVLAFERPPQQCAVAHVAHDALDGNRSIRWVLAAGRTSKRTLWPAACNNRTTTEPIKPLPPVTKTFSDRWVRDGKRGLSSGIAQRQHGRHGAIHFARRPCGVAPVAMPALILRIPMPLSHECLKTILAGWCGLASDVAAASRLVAAARLDGTKSAGFSKIDFSSRMQPAL